MGRDEKPTLEERLGHKFTEPEHLRDALTHRSFKNERPDLAPRDNERLEFLGDAILDLAASALLEARFSDAREGELTRRRADLVCERALAKIGDELGIGEALRLGRGEERSGGREKPRLVSSAVEAIVAAVYRDAGAVRALEIATELLEPQLDELAPGAHDHKSRLQELLQARGDPPPVYFVKSTEGPDHERTFFVEARVAEKPIGNGSGRSKLQAEQRAAANALEGYLKC